MAPEAAAQATGFRCQFRFHDGAENQERVTMSKTIELPATATDWQGRQQPRPVVKGTVCDHREDLDVTLVQQGKDKFAVIYGLQVNDSMDYTEAAEEYGACIFHALTCAGKLEN